MQFTLDLHFKLNIYRVVSSVTYIALEALDIQPGFPFVSKEEKGRIDKVLKTEYLLLDKTNTVFER